MERKKIPVLRFIGEDGKQTDEPMTIGAELIYPSSQRLYDDVYRIFDRFCGERGISAELSKEAYMLILERCGVEDDGTAKGRVNEEEQATFFYYAFINLFEKGIIPHGTKGEPYKISAKDILDMGISYNDFVRWESADLRKTFPVGDLETATLSLI